MRKAREKKVADDKKAEMEPKLKEKRTGKAAPKEEEKMVEEPVEPAKGKGKKGGKSVEPAKAEAAKPEAPAKGKGKAAAKKEEKVVIKHPITVVESTLAKPVNDKVLEVLGQFATENMDPLVGNGTDAEEYEDLEALDKQGHERKLSESLMKSLKETSKTHYAIHIGFMYGVSFANSKGELGEFELGPLSIIVRELRAK